MAKQVVDRHRQVMIRGIKTAAGGDHAMPIVVGVAGEGDVELVLEADQALHGIR